MRKKIAFDLDGTILDSRFRHQKVLYDILKEENFVKDLSELNDFVQYKSEGNNTKSYLKSKYGDAINADDVVERWIYNIEKSEYLDLDILYDDSLYLIKKLSKIYDLYLVTARSNKLNTLNQLKRLNIDMYFKNIIIVSNEGCSSIEKYNSTKKLDIDVIVGDTEVDFEWSRYLGVKFLPLLHGFRSEAWWKRKNIKTYRTLKQVEEVLLNI